jgi:hypothetical protein
LDSLALNIGRRATLNNDLKIILAIFLWKGNYYLEIMLVDIW